MLLEVLIALATLGIIYYLFLRPAKPLASRDVSRFKATSVSSSAASIRKPDSSSSSKPLAKPSSASQIKILFGSQTGTAEDFAATMGSECEALGLTVEIIDLEDYECSSLEHEPSSSLLLFMQATYGEGEPTDNAKDFWDNLSSLQEPLPNLHFGVFGLGNSTYEQYNWFGRQTKKRLVELGANEVVTYGEGDDDSTLEDDFAAWRKLALPLVAAFFGVSSDSNVAVKYKFRTRVKDVSTPGQDRRFSGLPNKSGAYDLNNPAYAPVLINRELHSPNSDRSCRHIEIQLPEGVSYLPGDHLGVYAHNDDTLVARVLKRLSIDPTRVIRLESLNGEVIVGPMSTTQMFRTYVDFYSTVPRKSLLEHLVRYVEDPEEAKRLKELTGKIYRSHVVDRHLTFLDLLDEFASLKPSLEATLELLPHLQPRYYSISSAPIKPDTVHITVSVVRFETPKREHKGVCSTWLARSQSTAAVFVRTSPFKMPADPATPVIMIGPGTGLAPFRGFLQQRAASASRDAPYVLFFGCRNREHDFIYREELEGYHADGVVELHTAFSRDQAEKEYVQHKMRLAGARLWELVDAGGMVYICGDANQMAKDVREELLAIFQEHGKLESKASAEAFLEDLSVKKRLHLDTWS